MSGLNFSTVPNLTCVPCNGQPDCRCLLQFDDVFVANNSATWNCIPLIFHSPFQVIISKYSIGIDFLLVISLRMSGNVKLLPYQFNTDLILVLQDLVEGTDYNLSQIAITVDTITISVSFTHSIKSTYLTLSIPSTSRIKSAAG